MSEIRRYHLQAVDGRPLPVALRYDEFQCVVTRGTLAVHEQASPFGDGQVEWELFGEIDGRPDPNAAGAIFWLGEEFERLDARHLTFPGGFRKRDLTPQMIATQSADGLELAPVGPDSPPDAVERLFGARTWRFVAAEATGAPANVTAG
jgi:hypothetical protein